MLEGLRFDLLLTIVVISTFNRSISLSAAESYVVYAVAVGVNIPDDML